MKLDNDKIEEIIELIELVISEDTHLQNALNDSHSTNFCRLAQWRSMPSQCTEIAGVCWP